MKDERDDLLKTLVEYQEEYILGANASYHLAMLITDLRAEIEERDET